MPLAKQEKSMERHSSPQPAGCWKNIFVGANSFGLFEYYDFLPENGAFSMRPF
jgi:hypothetical protein